MKLFPIRELKDVVRLNDHLGFQHVGNATAENVEIKTDTFQTDSQSLLWFNLSLNPLLTFELYKY